MNKTKQTFVPLLAAVLASAALQSRAEPASQLAQAQTIMSAQASPETKLDVLYNGGSKQLGAAIPAAGADASARHLDFGAAPSAGSTFDQASVPNPAASATQPQARVGFWDWTQETTVYVGLAILAAAAIIIATNQTAAGYNTGHKVGYGSGYNDGVNTTSASQAYSQGYSAGQTTGYNTGYSDGYAGRQPAQ